VLWTSWHTRDRNRKSCRNRQKRGSLQCHQHIFNPTPSDLFPFSHIADPGKDNVFSSSTHYETEAYSGKGESSLRSRTCTEWKWIILLLQVPKQHSTLYSSDWRQSFWPWQQQRYNFLCIQLSCMRLSSLYQSQNGAWVETSRKNFRHQVNVTTFCSLFKVMNVKSMQ